MRFVNMFRSLTGKAKQEETTEPRAIVIMQRKLQHYSEGDLRTAGERGWSRKFDGEVDSMYFVSVHSALTVVKAGSHIIRVTSVPTRYADDDEFALAHLPQAEQKKAWNEHRACTFLDLFNDLAGESRIPDPEAYASLAKLALGLDDTNCTAIFLPMKNMMFPNDGTAEQGLRLLIKKELPMNR